MRAKSSTLSFFALRNSASSAPAVIPNGGSPSGSSGSRLSSSAARRDSGTAGHLALFRSWFAAGWPSGLRYRCPPDRRYPQPHRRFDREQECDGNALVSRYSQHGLCLVEAEHKLAHKLGSYKLVSGLTFGHRLQLCTSQIRVRIQIRCFALSLKLKDGV